jgi:hypothetical protein
MNTIDYIQRFPRLMSDKEFLLIYFNALWDSIERKG